MLRSNICNVARDPASEARVHMIVFFNVSNFMYVYIIIIIIIYLTLPPFYIFVCVRTVGAHIRVYVDDAVINITRVVHYTHTHTHTHTHSHTHTHTHTLTHVTPPPFLYLHLFTPLRYR